MTPAAIIREAAADGVSLALSPAGTIKATGDQVAVNRWVPILREHKLAMQLRSQHPRECPHRGLVLIMRAPRGRALPDPVLASGLCDGPR
jgi:hypothetical protein